MLVRSGLVLAASLTIGAVAAGAAQHFHRGHHVTTASQSGDRQTRAVNDRCPIQGEEVDSETPMRVWRGHSIGFCCPGCDTRWDAKPDAEKDAFLAKHVKVVPASPAIELARRFQAARAAGDSVALDGMFLSGGKATVLHNGNDAGAWEQYRDEILKPELKTLGVAAWRTVTETETRLDGETLVGQTVSLTTGEGAAKRELSAAVTLVVVDDAGTPKIAHLHWSSREVEADKTRGTP